MAFIRKLMDWFDVHPQVVMASELAVKSDDRNLRLVEICQMFGAKTYISGTGAKCYLDENLFALSGIKVEWREWVDFPHSQLVREFVPQLSAVDFLMHCHPSLMRQFVASPIERNHLTEIKSLPPLDRQKAIAYKVAMRSKDGKCK